MQNTKYIHSFANTVFTKCKQVFHTLFQKKPLILCPIVTQKKNHSLKQKNIKLQIVNIILLTFTLARCAPLSSMVTGTASVGGSTSGPATAITGPDTGLGNSATETPSSTDTENVDDPTETGNDMQAFIPPPSNGETIITGPDASGNSYATASGFEAGSTMGASVSGGTAMWNNVKNYLASSMSYLWNHTVVNTCYAESTATCPANTTCETLDSTGYAAFTIPNCTATSTVNFFYVDPTTGETSTSITDTPLMNLVYTADVPAGTNAITSDGNSLYAVSENGSVNQMDYDSTTNRFFMTGDIAVNYAMGTITDLARELDYDTSNDVFIARSSTEVLAREYNGTEFVDVSSSLSSSCFVDGECNSTPVCKESDGCSPTLVQIRSGKVYYGTEYTTTQTNGRIQELYDNVGSYFEFLNSSTIGFKSTKAFDTSMTAIEDLAEYFVVFEDGSSNLQLYGKYNLPTKTLRNLNLTSNGITNVIDLAITDPHIAGEDVNTTSGATLLTSDSLYFLNYNLYDRGSSTAITLGTSVAIANPIAMAVSDDSDADGILDYAYVLSNGGDSTTADDDYITVVDLETKSQTSVMTLSDQLSGKTVGNFSPNTIHYITEGDKNYVVVGTNLGTAHTMAAAIVIEL